MRVSVGSGEQRRRRIHTAILVAQEQSIALTLPASDVAHVRRGCWRGANGGAALGRVRRSGVSVRACAPENSRACGSRALSRSATLGRQQCGP